MLVSDSDMAEDPYLDWHQQQQPKQQSSHQHHSKGAAGNPWASQRLRPRPPPGPVYQAHPPSSSTVRPPPPSGPGWTVLGFTDQGPVWFDTLAHYTTYRSPDRPAGAPQHRINRWADMDGLRAALPLPPRPKLPPPIGCQPMRPPPPPPLVQ